MKMNVIGLICEYNPFHNGHIYHIKKIKELYPNSLLILVLNGYFLQRGEISILTKEEKTKIALDFGINIVLELPAIYGTQAADIFAEAAVKILNKYNVDTIVFGSESNDIDTLKKIAKMEFDPKFHEKVLEYLKTGINYPTSLAKSLNTNHLFTPNDLLGISYIKAIIKNNYSIKPVSIKRTSNYHDTLSSDEIISAKNIREKIKNGEDITKYLPKSVCDKFIRIDYDIYFKLLKTKIITDYNLDDYIDITEGLDYRLRKLINDSNDYDTFIGKLKTKRYTTNRLNRMFIHVLLGMKKSDNNYISDYTKVLGFDSEGQNYLKNFKYKEYNKVIRGYELKASLIYDLINNTDTYSFELKNKPIKKLD